MSERPATLQLLKRGKLICSAVFPLIVETWNWLVEAFDGLKGDYDVNPQDGYVTVDRTDPAHPVIRLARTVKASGGDPTPSPSTSGGIKNFEFKDGEISGGVVCIARQYYSVKGIAASEDGEYRLKFSLSTTSNLWVVVVEQGDGFAAPADTTSYAPLYEIKDGEVLHDYRAAIHLMVRE